MTRNKNYALSAQADPRNSSPSYYKVTISRCRKPLCYRDAMILLSSCPDTKTVRELLKLRLRGWRLP